MSHIAVLATSQSRSSLHRILVSSRGAHLVQEVMDIKAPNKVGPKMIKKIFVCHYEGHPIKNETFFIVKKPVCAFS